METWPFRLDLSTLPSLSPSSHPSLECCNHVRSPHSSQPTVIHLLSVITFPFCHVSAPMSCSRLIREGSSCLSSTQRNRTPPEQSCVPREQGRSIQNVGAYTPPAQTILSSHSRACTPTHTLISSLTHRRGVVSLSPALAADPKVEGEDKV